MQSTSPSQDRLVYWIEFIKRRLTPGFKIAGPYSNDADVWYDICAPSGQNATEMSSKLQVGIQTRDARFFYCRPGAQRTILGTDVEALQSGGFRELTRLGMI